MAGLTDEAFVQDEVCSSCHHFQYSNTGIDGGSFDTSENVWPPLIGKF